ALKYRHRLVADSKTFRFRRPLDVFGFNLTKDPDLVICWVNESGPKVIYRWPDVVARPTDVVYVCEGEKDADRLASLGLLATTVPSQSWTAVAVSALEGRDTVVLEDNDDAGRKNSTAAVAALTGVAKSIRVVRLPHLPYRGDVSDWLDAGRTKEEFVAACEATQ